MKAGLCFSPLVGGYNGGGGYALQTDLGQKIFITGSPRFFREVEPTLKHSHAHCVQHSEAHRRTGNELIQKEVAVERKPERTAGVLTTEKSPLRSQCGAKTQNLQTLR